jgi:hypothetical protein
VYKEDAHHPNLLLNVFTSRDAEVVWVSAEEGETGDRAVAGFFIAAGALR